jgi:hypothetical protein
VVRTSAADAVREQVRDAVKRGARQLMDESRFAANARRERHIWRRRCWSMSITP